MKQKCIRCVVQLSLDELHWVDNDDVNIHLDGPPLFLRACVLGQLQHSHLHKPVFPVSLDQELTFDRVLTNCKNPSLFNEVIRGEHIKIELIQVAPDYKGGKILARFESPAHRFLFPEVPPTKGELQHVQLNKSRKYQHPPSLTYTCSSTLLETTVQSPVDVIFNESQLDRSSQLNHSTTDTDSDSETSSDEGQSCLTRSALDSSQQHGRSSAASRRLFQSERERSCYLDENHSLRSTAHRGLSRSQPSLVNATAGTMDGYTSAREKLRSLLESYTRPQREERRHQELPKSPYRVKFKPPVPRFRSEHVLPASGGRRDGDIGDDTILSSSRPTTPSYRSPTVGIGPHEWQNCPRRSPKRVRSRSLPNSPAPRAKFPKQQAPPLHHRQATTVPNQIPLDRLEAVHLDCGHPDLTPRQYQHQSAPDLRPPFVVPRPDPKLISKRNFCGEVGVMAIRHLPLSTPPKTSISTGAGRQSPAPPTATMATTTSGIPYWREDISDDKLRNVTDSDSDTDDDNIGLERDPLSASPEDGPTIASHLHSNPATQWTHSSGHYTKSHDIHALKSGSIRKPRSSSLRSPHPQSHSSSPSPAPVRHTRSNPTTPVKNKPQSSRGIPSSLSSASRKYASTTSAHARGSLRSSRRHRYHRRRELVSKYLVERSGNGRRKGMASPSKVIVDKIQRLRDECCACLHSVDSLGEDDLSEDLKRLKASLEAEREETMNKSARLLPDKNVTVKIGPRDYWSKRMAEYTGKRHRVLFDETLEKIYNRLYRDATNSA